MKPLVHHNKMTDITPAEQKKLCRCSSRCESFVVISYTRGPVLTMCETETKKYIAEIAQGIGLIKPNFIKGRRTWTIAEENRLIDLYQEYKGKYGFLKTIARELGFEHKQIKWKLFRLKESGRIQGGIIK